MRASSRDTLPKFDDEDLAFAFGDWIDAVRFAGLEDEGVSWLVPILAVSLHVSVRLEREKFSTLKGVGDHHVHRQYLLS